MHEKRHPQTLGRATVATRQEGCSLGKLKNQKFLILLFEKNQNVSGSTQFTYMGETLKWRVEKITVFKSKHTVLQTSYILNKINVACNTATIDILYNIIDGCENNF